MAANQNGLVHYMLLAIVSCDLVFGTYGNIIKPGHVHISPSETVENGVSLSSSEIATNNNNNNNNNQHHHLQHHDTNHRIVKRKSKIGRGFGFGKSKSKPKVKNQPAYPKQPAHNPNYNPGHNAGNMGPPPAYPGNNRMNYPHNPPPAYPHNPSYPRNNQPSYPSYPSGGYNTGYGGSGGGFNNRGFGKGMGGGGGLGKTLGSAGFGAIAGTALGAYGGYKLGRMIGGLGRQGHYGYYNDNGRYIRCDPPKVTKVDPETNITYIPLEDDYDKRCSYFDRPPPPTFSGYTNGSSQNIAISFSVLLLTIVLSTFNIDLFNIQNRIAVLTIAGLAILL